jgi:hypothetical protein
VTQLLILVSECERRGSGLKNGQKRSLHYIKTITFYFTPNILEKHNRYRCRPSTHPVCGRCYLIPYLGAGGLAQPFTNGNRVPRPRRGFCDRACSELAEGAGILNSLRSAESARKPRRGESPPSKHRLDGQEVKIPAPSASSGLALPHKTREGRGIRLFFVALNIWRKSGKARP